MIEIREQRAGDQEDADGVIRAAFGQEDEVALVAALKKNSELLLSLIAEADGRIAGHIGFARGWVQSEGGRTAFAWLVPLSVTPDHQKRGIGTALVNAGLERCREKGFAHAIVVGDPAYYGRFGFTGEGAEDLVSRWSGALLAAPLSQTPARLRGRVIEPAAFEGLE
ncbi:hypothetical protein BMS3Bbin10_02429 [bacterium BMS3Bbin10]|nr:hypothetical protein BMS3Bbin10_02429 [bacterium BMS3Bbin10]